MVTPIEQAYVDLHPKSAEYYATSKDLFPNGVTHDARNLKPFPYFVTHAQGPRKWDVDGNEIVDYKGGHGALILGHNHPDIVAVVTEQMTKGTHFAASTELEIQWAQLVRDLIPCSEKVRFHSSGTEATMMAVRMARAYTGRTKLLKFRDHFHGWNDYVRSHEPAAGGIPAETASTVISIEPNDIGLVERTLAGDKDVAAVIIEPTGAHMGDTPLRPSFLGELREVTERYGVVLIFDEVVTGFRMSKGGAQGLYGVTPDMCTLAKILGGGLPGGAVTGKAEIIDMIQLRDEPGFNSSSRIGHNGTFNANPLSAAAGQKALELVKTQPINANADRAAARLRDGLNGLLNRMEITGTATGVASAVFLRLGVEVDPHDDEVVLTEQQERTVSDPMRKDQLTLAMYNHGVDGGPRFLVSSVHSDDDIDQTVEVAGRALAELREQGLV